MLMIWLLLLTALGCALVGGVLFAFSTFVMRGLASLPAVIGVESMRAINRVAVTPAFMALFLGTTMMSTMVVISAALSLNGDQAILAISGGLCYLVGSFGVTAAINVPLNNRLDRVDENEVSFWSEYVQRWTRWNHLRTVSCVTAGVLLVLAALGVG
jgi:uncharacterized membrane protein